MKFYLLSDDPDAIIGLRLAGVEGKLIENGENAVSEIESISQNSEIGMILITPGVSAMCADLLTELKKKNQPIIVEIPDSNPLHNQSDSVTDYIRNAIGIKI